MDYDMHEAIALVGISPETLQDWSERFASLLSSTAQSQQTTHANGTELRYTENDIALLVQLKALLDDGHTYEQAQAMLNNRQPDNKPKRSARRPPRQKAEAQALTSTANISKELGAPQLSSEQIIATKDQQIAELEQMLQLALRANNERTLALKEQHTIELEHMLETEQRRAEQGSKQVEQLKAENQMLRKWLDQAEKGHTHAYSLLLKVLLIIIVVGVLITILIEFMFKF